MIGTVIAKAIPCYQSPMAAPIVDEVAGYQHNIAKVLGMIVDLTEAAVPVVEGLP